MIFKSLLEIVNKKIVNHKDVQFAKEKNTLGGNNAGHQAINLAWHLGYKIMILLGFDCNTAADKTDWHNKHKRVSNKDNYTNTMIPGFKSLASVQKEYEFKVYNVNPKSAITCFEYISLQDAITKY